MGASVPVREARAPAGPRGPLVPVRLTPLVPVPDTNQDNHWSRFMSRTGTKWGPLVPVLATNWDQWLWARSEVHWSRFVSGTGNKGVTFCPGSRHEPGPMVVGQERGTLVPVRVWNRDQRGQTNRNQWPTRPGRRPGLTNWDRCPHMSRFVSESGLMGFSGLDQSPVFY